MGRSNTINAIKNSTAIKQYKDEHPTASLRQIATEFGISATGVKKILDNRIKATEQTRWPEMRDLITARRYEAAARLDRYGLFSALSDLNDAGYDPMELPSWGTIERWINNCGKETKVARKGIISSNRLQYWSEQRPEAPNKRGLIDTASTTIANNDVTLLLYIDWYSRFAHIEMTPSKIFARYLPWFLNRSFHAGGGNPKTIQCDNGFGFNQSYYHRPSNAQEWAFQNGVQRWEFIPVAEAFRNGKVERLVQTAKSYLEGRTWTSIEEARTALRQWVHYYNAIRIHKGISTRKKGNTNSPANICNYLQPTEEAPQIVLPSKQGIDNYEIVYKRFVSSGVAIISSPKAFIPVSPQLTGRYVDIIISSNYQNGNRGRIEYSETINHGSDDAKLITHLISRFECLQPIVHVKHEAHAAFTPIPTDEYEMLRAQYVHLKDKKPKPSWVLPGISRKDIEKDWQLIDDKTQEIMYDSRYCNNIDHLEEIAQ